ncbi:hypothetical protein F5I97DRAFT_1881294 [Phlebopus sp. FC_14]|nr:hypothetical protein F5I97DRAFT_1881294 [Phlebopus sp. FC_14]
MMSATAVLATYTIFICIIILKSCLAIRSGFGRTPLVSLLIREGITIYGFVIVYFAVALISIMQGDDRAMTLFMWAVSISSTCGCRLIISLERLGRNLGIRSSEPAFTSQIEL